jgi:DtxR family Mn-dependent transcriptional regulator
MLTGKQTRNRSLTASHEHYLRAIWQVRVRQGYARVTDVARELNIAPASLSVGIRPLVARNLIGHDVHRFLVLTTEGEAVARKAHHRFVVAGTFLADVLGVPRDQALEEACLLEHSLSETTAERLLDIVKLLRDDSEFRAFFQQRLQAYHRSCVPVAECSTCDLACLAGETAPA